LSRSAMLDHSLATGCLRNDL